MNWYRLLFGYDRLSVTLSSEPDGNYIARRMRELGLDKESPFITKAREQAKKWLPKKRKVNVTPIRIFKRRA